MKHPVVKSDYFNDMPILIIQIPDDKPIIEKNYRSHYLWIGEKNKCLGTISNKVELKKLRRLINKIIGDE